MHHSQQTASEEERIISIDVRPNNELIAQILSFGPDVKVLSPEPFKQQIFTKIKENFEHYNTL